MSNSTPSQVSPVAPGSVLAGKYRVERIIGHGGMGLVVEARHIVLDERVALKFLLPDYAMHPEASTRFLREAKAAVKIKSEHVARVTDVGTLDTGAPYMVMEFLEGRDLARTLEVVGVLPIADAIDYILQACEAIAEAHNQGIVHRDLKPANLFLSKRPDGSPIVKVLDFGISKISGGGVENLTKTMAALGSALYMSPEQMQQTRSVDHRTDIYALGISLYELLAGKQPFYAETLPQLCAEILTGTPTPLRSIRPEVPEEIAQVVERAYARDRGQRYQSIAEFVVAIAPFAPARSQTMIERVARMAGLSAPLAGSAGERTSSPPARSSSAELQGPGGTQVFPSSPALSQTPGAGLPSQAFPRTTPLPSLDAQPPSITVQPLSRPGTDGNQIILGPYSAPMSARAAASFAEGPPLNEELLLKVRRSGHGARRKHALVGAIFAVVALGVMAAGFALRSGPHRSGTHAVPAMNVDFEAPVTPTADKPTAVTTEPAASLERVAPPEPPKPAEGAPLPSASAAPSALPATSSTFRKVGPKPPAPTSGPLVNPSTVTPSGPPKKTDIYDSSH